MNTMTRTSAAQSIQRVWRGANVRFFEPRRKQLGPQVYGHQSLANPLLFGNIGVLNRLHELWGAPTPTKAQQKIRFSTLTRSRDNLNRDFIEPAFLNEGTDRPAYLFAKIIEAAFRKKSIREFFNEHGAEDLDKYFSEAIHSLEQGQRVPLWDGKSTHINANEPSLKIVRDSYELYKVYQRDKGTSTPPPSTTDDLEMRFLALLESKTPPKKPLDPLPEKIRPLVRVAPRSVFCDNPIRSARTPTPKTMPIPKPPPTREELDAKLQKLINMHRE